MEPSQAKIKHQRSWAPISCFSEFFGIFRDFSEFFGIFRDFSEFETYWWGVQHWKKTLEWTCQGTKKQQQRA